MAVVPLPRPIHFGLHANANRERNIGDGYWDDASGFGGSDNAIVTHLGMIACNASQVGANRWHQYRFPATTSVVFGGWLSQLLVSRNNFLRFTDASLTNLISVSTDASQRLVISRGLIVDGNILATTTRSISAVTWRFVEIALLISEAGGTLHVWFNGALDVALTGLNTGGAIGTGSVDLVRHGFQEACILGDGYIDAASGAAAAWGPGRVFDFRPSADTAEADWTPSAGADGFAMVDEVLSDGDTTYVESLLGGNRSRWEVTGETLLGTPRCVWPYAVAIAPQGGADRIVVSIDSDAERESSVELEVPTSPYGTVAYPVPLDPDGDVAWTPASVAASEPSIEHVEA